MKNLKFFAVKIFLIIFFSNTFAASENTNQIVKNGQNQFCTDKNGNKYTKYIYLNEINNLELVLDDHRSWFKNQFRIIVHRNINIPKKYKKKFKGKLFVNLINNTRCQFNATVRVHGDAKDHIKMIDGNIYSSLNIRLNSGNIESIIKFILLLPETRNNDNEIFASILLKELGFISPRTKYLNLKFK